jgi:hypothetical protein
MANQNGLRILLIIYSIANIVSPQLIYITFSIALFVIQLLLEFCVESVLTVDGLIEARELEPSFG